MVENIPGLDEVVKDFERSDNVIKIKKLLLCATKNRWENNESLLESLDLASLIKDIYEESEDFGHLESLVLQVIKKLNKKVPYFLLANTLVQKLSKIYPDNQAKRKRIRTQLKQLKRGVKYPYDLSDLKFAVSRESTVRRAKVLVFSALNFKFGYSTQDWATLDSLDFDELVRALFYACETPEDLEFRLYGTALCLDESDKQIKTASLIVESMMPYYQDVQRGRDITQDVDEDDTTAIEFASHYNRPSDIQLVAFNKKDEDEEEESYNVHYDIKIPDFVLVNEEGVSKVSQLIKKQIELEESIKGVVEERVNQVMGNVETTVGELESYLDEYLEKIPSSIAPQVKYHALRLFVKKLLEKSSKYLEIIDNLEANAAKKG